jgi:hypothetical protein
MTVGTYHLIIIFPSMRHDMRALFLQDMTCFSLISGYLLLAGAFVQPMVTSMRRLYRQEGVQQ